MIKNRKQMFIIIFVFALILFLGGTTYAWFSYRATSADQEMIAGDIYLHLNEGTGEISRENIFSETPEEARARNDNFITFNIEGINESNKTIYYEFILDHGIERSDQTKSRYNDSDLRFDLVALDSNGDEDEYLLSNVGYDTLINKRIYVDTIDNNTNSQVVRRYKLRMWLADTVIISDTDPNRSYTTTEYKNKYATIKLIVAGDFIEKEAPKQAYNLIQKLSSSKSYIQSYDSIIANNQTYKTQDTYYENNNKKTVYYYTGSEAADNNNVLFGGYCWQIVRTTDNGGVKLLYNGIAEKDVTYTPVVMSDTDITYTNDTSYPYSYDSNNKRWTSTNHSDRTYSDFSFNVKEAGYYYIHYYISSEEEYDFGYIMKYINSKYIILKYDDGENESYYDLGYLSTSDTVVIEYEKDNVGSDFDDNIKFEIIMATERVESDNLQCQNTRKNHKGISGSKKSLLLSDLNNASIFGRSYDYNLETGLFTLEDTSGLPTTWSDSDANNNGKKDSEELIGTYTCLSSSSSCSRIYYIGTFLDDIDYNAVAYTIFPTSQFNNIGQTAYNFSNRSLSMTGYMFNKIYTYHVGMKSGQNTYHTTVSWNGTEYILSSNDSGTSSPNNTHRYICDTDCTKVRYYYYYNSTTNNAYILLENGKNIDDALKEMLNHKTSASDDDAEINVYNSPIKGLIDNWYKKNLTSYSSYLDNDTVYCNTREIGDFGSWKNDISNDDAMYFMNYSSSVGADQNLECNNITDRFSSSNQKAKLKYPVGLLTTAEIEIMGNYSYQKSVDWLMNPSYIYVKDTRGSVAFYHYYDSPNLITGFASIYYTYNVRPVITLNKNAKFDSGDGTVNNPYIVGPIVERNE